MSKSCWPRAAACKHYLCVLWQGPNTSRRQRKGRLLLYEDLVARSTVCKLNLESWITSKLGCGVKCKDEASWIKELETVLYSFYIIGQSFNVFCCTYRTGWALYRKALWLLEQPKRVSRSLRKKGGQIVSWTCGFVSWLWLQTLLLPDFLATSISWL